MTCGIYMIQNKVNNKIYIGQAVDIKDRWGGHKSELRGNYHVNTHLQRSWNKYGEDNFEFTILLECEESDLNMYEEYYIFELMTYDDRVGYNKTYGGQSGRPTEATKKKIAKTLNGHIVSEQTREKISKANKGENHPNYGKPCSEQTKQKISVANKGENNYWYGKSGAKNPSSVPVVQLTLDGDLVNVYESIQETRRMGFITSAISGCCRGERNKHGGYKWMYLHEYDSTIDISSINTLNLFENLWEVTPKRIKSVQIVQLTLEGELVNVYESAAEAGRKGFNDDKIRMCCQGKRNKHKGYRWMYRYEYETLSKEDIKKMCENSKGKNNPNSIPVVQLTLDGELVNVYDAIKEAERCGFNDSLISRCCKGTRKTHKGYKWMYLSEYEAMKKEG